jgi:hypothetical protein
VQKRCRKITRCGEGAGGRFVESEMIADAVRDEGEMCGSLEAHLQTSSQTRRSSADRGLLQ